MNIIEKNAKSILRKYKKIDSWFITHYGMNLYRGCLHNCVYCDGRAERYYVDGEFGKDIIVKNNASEIFNRKLNPKRKRIPFKQSYIMLGGGVGDAYQPIEKKYRIARKAIKIIYKYNFPIHILTKSVLVKRDIDIIKKIDEKRKAIVSFSFSSTNAKVSSIFEPGVPTPRERFDSITYFKKQGISCGMYLMPVIPFITDTPEIMEKTIKNAVEAGIDFIIFSGLTLRFGRQKSYFLNSLKKHFPEYMAEYKKLYTDNKLGTADEKYYHSLNMLFYHIVKKYKIPCRIPPVFFKSILSENDFIIVLLEHIDYLSKMQGMPSPYGYAAWSISKLKDPLRDNRKELRKIKGVGPVTERIILEILDTGKSSYYEKLAGYH